MGRTLFTVFQGPLRSVPPAVPGHPLLKFIHISGPKAPGDLEVLESPIPYSWPQKVLGTVVLDFPTMTHRAKKLVQGEPVHTWACVPL